LVLKIFGERILAKKAASKMLMKLTAAIVGIGWTVNQSNSVITDHAIHVLTLNAYVIK
jgi:hypothetical protein